MIRVCPKRDAICPHGMGCEYTIDRYQCREEPVDAFSSAETSRPLYATRQLRPVTGKDTP